MTGARGRTRVLGGPVNLAQRARIATGLSQRELARRLGVSHSSFERWEAGTVPSSMARNLLRLIELHPQFVLDELEKNGPAVSNGPSRGAT